jgi:ADP-ribosyl-[dinitrogen reductase] hydrolase
MRTAPVALAHLGDDAAIADASRAVAALTHADPLAGDSCVLWGIAIDRAIRDERLDGVRDGLASLPQERRGFWSDALDRGRATFATHVHRRTASP